MQDIQYRDFACKPFEEKIICQTVMSYTMVLNVTNTSNEFRVLTCIESIKLGS